jgi:hypothetical protein
MFSPLSAMSWGYHTIFPPHNDTEQSRLPPHPSDADIDGTEDDNADNNNADDDADSKVDDNADNDADVNANNNADVNAEKG